MWCFYDMHRFTNLQSNILKGIHSFVCVCTHSHSSHVWIFVTPWIVPCQTPLSMGFPRQEYWSGVPFPPPGGLPDPGMDPCLLHWQVGSSPLCPWEALWWVLDCVSAALNSEALQDRGSAASPFPSTSSWRQEEKITQNPNFTVTSKMDFQKVNNVLPTTLQFLSCLFQLLFVIFPWAIVCIN